MRLSNAKPKFVVVGRKRKPGMRKPSGDLIPPRDIDPKVIALRMPHRTAVPQSVAHDPKAEQHLGVYNLNGKITNQEYEAGKWYAETVNRYRAVIDAPKSSPSSNAGVLVPIFGGQPYAMDDDEAQRRTSIYNAAFEVVGGVSQKAAKAVARVAVYGERCPDDLWRQFRLGLLALAVHRGLFTDTDKELVDIRRVLWLVGNRY